MPKRWPSSVAPSKSDLTYADANGDLARAEAATGDLAAAAEHFRKAVRLRPSEWYQALVALYVRQGKKQEALQVCEEAARVLPPTAENHYCRGTMWESVERPTEAAAQYRAAIELDSGIRPGRSSARGAWHAWARPPSLNGMGVRMDPDSRLVFEASASTSTGLIDSVRLGDASAWQRLVSYDSPLVYAWCRRSEMASSDAADVMQEVFVAVWRGLAGFRREEPGETFRGWLRVIARNKITDHFRRQSMLPLRGRRGQCPGSAVRRPQR